MRKIRVKPLLIMAAGTAFVIQNEVFGYIVLSVAVVFGFGWLLNRIAEEGRR